MLAAAMRHRIKAGLILVSILVLIIIVYWPVSRAGFVWIDKIIFHDAAWLRVGEDWQRYVFHNFYVWVNYFRPLVVALFVLEVRTFDVAAGPMHLVSLAIHVANTVLVGLFAHSIFSKRQVKGSFLLSGVSMLLYGLHPALVEPVVWISCQFELLVTFFVLLALLINSLVQPTAVRAILVAAMFFLAACAKESAISLPLLLFIFDVLYEQVTEVAPGWGVSIRSTWKRQRYVYLCVFLAGIAYLIARYESLGFVVQPMGGQPLLSAQRLQEICYLYVTYWRILIWPMTGLGPIHTIDASRFAMFDLQSIAIDLAATAFLMTGTYLAWRRKIAGALILAITVALAPALHIVPVTFDESLYHERYAMLAVAMACSFVPLLLAATFAWKRLAAFGIVTVWLALAVVNIRVTIPLWSDETKLWLWVLREHPDSVRAKSGLLTTYIELNDHVHARQIADQMLAEKTQCPLCMINVAYLAIADGNESRAAAALNEAEGMMSWQQSSETLRAFILATGQLRELKGNFSAAEEAYRDAVSMEPLDPQAQMNLATVLIRQGKLQQARSAMEHALYLYAPDEREQRRRAFEQAVETSAKIPKA